jgi:hypothetical protein
MMRALTQFDYMGLRRRLKAGELFEPCSLGDARTLALAQLAVEVDDDESPPKKSKKRYQRADMRAEDSE